MTQHVLREDRFETRIRSAIEVATPKGLSMERTGEKYVITRRWYSYVAWLTLIVAIAFDILALAGVFALSSASNVNLTGILVVVGLLGVGGLFSWFSAATFINKTCVEFDKHGVRVRHAPLPWIGQRFLEAQSIQLISAVEYRSPTGSVRFHVNAWDTSGRRYRLVGSMVKADQAHFIAQQLIKGFGRSRSAERSATPR